MAFEVDVAPLDFDSNGFTFGVLSDVAVNGEYPAREQFETNLFTADYNNQPFVANKLYLFTGYHPDYMPDTQIGRIVFDEAGVPRPVTPEESIGIDGSFGTGNLGIPIIPGTPVAGQHLAAVDINGTVVGTWVAPDQLNVIIDRSSIPAVAVSLVESFMTLHQATPGTGPVLPSRLFPEGVNELLTSRLGPNDAGRIAAALANLIDLDYVLRNGKGVSDEGMTMTGDGNYVTIRLFGGSASKRGWLHYEQQADGSFPLRAELRYDPVTGKLILGKNGGNQIEIDDDFIGINAATIQGNAAMRMNNYSASTVPVAARANGLAVFGTHPQDPNLWQIQELRAQGVIDLILSGDLTQVAATIKLLLQDFDLTDNVYECVEACDLVGSTTPEVVVQPYRAKITSAMINAEQTHGLDAPGTDLFPILLDKYGLPDTTMLLSFPTDNTYFITYPEGLTEGYEGGKLRLELI